MFELSAGAVVGVDAAGRSIDWLGLLLLFGGILGADTGTMGFISGPAIFKSDVPVDTTGIGRSLLGLRTVFSRPNVEVGSGT